MDIQLVKKKWGGMNNEYWVDALIVSPQKYEETKAELYKVGYHLQLTLSPEKCMMSENGNPDKWFILSCAFEAKMPMHCKAHPNPPQFGQPYCKDCYKESMKLPQTIGNGKPMEAWLKAWKECPWS